MTTDRTLYVALEKQYIGKRFITHNGLNKAEHIKQRHREKFVSNDYNQKLPF